MIEPGRVSVVLPARNEQFLSKTVADILAKAHGDIEVIPVLDGVPADPPLPIDPRVKPIIHPVSIGMRPCINQGMAAATGEYLMKLDGHCMLGEGFDEILKADCDRDWIVVPRRYALDPIVWVIEKTGKGAIDAHYLSCPYDTRPIGSSTHRPGDGLQGVWWPERARARRDVLIDDEMQSQGSCWFMTRTYWDRRGPMDVSKYGTFIREFQELGNVCWLGGGRCVVNKKTWYAHLHKGNRYGRGYPLSGSEADAGSKFCVRYWMLDEWPERVRNLRWLIEKFSPVPGWPADIDEAFAQARKVYGVA